jgi:hypothetical protein
MRFVSFLAAGALAAPAIAQLSLVAPNGYAATQGNTNNAFPWNQAATSTHSQFIYDSTNFTLQGVNTPVLINRLRYRPAPGVTTWSGGSWPTVRIDLATCPTDFLAVSTTYASNLGPDVTTVHNGPVVVQAGSGTSPTAWHIDIALTTPFLYDPTGGDLTVDIQLTGTGWSGQSCQADHVSGVTALGTRLFNTTSATAPTGTIGTNYVAVCEFGYVNPGGGPVATNTTLGSGCVNVPDVSSYELFGSAASFDLSNNSIWLVHTGNGYLALPGATPYVTPSPTAQTLTLTDDSETTVTLSQPMRVGASGSTTSLVVCSNGYVSAASGNGTGFTPTVSTFLNGSRAWWCLAWHDYNPAITTAGAGRVKFEQIGNIAYITWEGVWDFGGTTAANANTFQAQFDVTTGSVTYVYGTMSTLGNGFLVGFSDGGNSADPGSMDISAALPATYQAATFAVLPLQLSGATRPILNTNWNLTTSNVPSNGTIGLDIFGLTDPNIADLGFLGAPGCGSRASLDVVNAWIVAGSTHAYSLAIPNNPALLAFQVYTQGAVLQPGVNTLLGGIITSNGIRGTLGSQ